MIKQIIIFWKTGRKKHRQYYLEEMPEKPVLELEII
jgi:hypothetical protein